jgi:hypothetical protein
MPHDRAKYAGGMGVSPMIIDPGTGRKSPAKRKPHPPAVAEGRGVPPDSVPPKPYFNGTERRMTDPKLLVLAAWFVRCLAVERHVNGLYDIEDINDTVTVGVISLERTQRQVGT